MLLSPLLGLFLVLSCIPATSRDLQLFADSFEFTVSVNIDAELEQVFCYLGNPINDPEWVREEESITANGPWMVGTQYTEEISNLLLPENVFLKFDMISMTPPRQIVVEAPPGEPYFRDERNFQTTTVGGRTQTAMSLTMLISTELVQETFTSGIPVPTPLVRFTYVTSFGLNLQNAKRIIESATTSLCTN